MRKILKVDIPVKNVIGCMLVTSIGHQDGMLTVNTDSHIPLTREWYNEVEDWFLSENRPSLFTLTFDDKLNQIVGK